MAIAPTALDHLLTNLDVQLQGYSVCEIANGVRLLVEPKELIILHLVVGGNGTLKVGKGREAVIGPCSMIVIPAHQPQAIIAGERAICDVQADTHCAMRPDGVQFYDAAGGATGDLRMVCATLTATYGRALGLFDALVEPLVETLDDSALPATIELLLSERRSQDIGTRAVVESLIKVAMVMLLRRHLNRADTPSPFLHTKTDKRLTAALALIVDEPGAKITVAQLARAAGMSRSSFAKAFVEAFQQTPMGFVHKARLEKAATLLANTTAPVKVVAANSGFASRSHFSRAFRAHHGVDPSEYRDSDGRNASRAPKSAGGDASGPCAPTN